MGYPGSRNLKTREKVVQRYERRIKRQRDLGHDDSMDIEETVTVDLDPPYADDEKASCCCDQAARIQELEAETKRLTEELLAQQQGALYYSEKCTKLQDALNKEVFTANNLSEKQLKYFTGVRFEGEYH